MAKLRIEVEQNEYALFDADVYCDDVLWTRLENYTAEHHAIAAGTLAAQEKWALND